MANRLRGEIEAVLDGRRWTLVLTLGALAELEAAYGAQDLGALTERFSSGRLSASDLTKIIGAGLRGAGNAVDDEQVSNMVAPGGAAGFAAVAADLLAATFGSGEEAADPSNPM
ncbi:gene transfer agent family protein [Rhizobiales bacterium]|uniref:gene transfer agent family protein n=1 Tax=Hongsoonwoonella zoysiae TaxID=2821844 RepID=UPI001561604C|nr:gene transfer agent family protein [Hongsoonwoonella zoysiae]NRG19391.1 gene transfer agent family protein [Hongsoonwoonella zoysiae]